MQIKKTSQKRLYFLLLFLIILILGALFRFTNLNWDNGNRIHPDEAVIVNATMRIRFISQLNPNFHDYNGLPVYILRGVSEVVSVLTHDPSYTEIPETMTLVGRYISAFVSTLTVVLVFVFSLQFFPAGIALVATTLAAFSPLGIQLAHFYTTDTLLALFLISMLLGITRYIQKHDTRSFIFAGFALGAAIATKNTGYFFIPIPVLSLLFVKTSVKEKIRSIILLTCITITTFFILSPFSFIDITGYWKRSVYLQQLVSGKTIFDWTMQFQHTSPFYWCIQNIWAFGPMNIIGCIGMCISIYDHIKRKTAKTAAVLLISGWTIGFSIFLSLSFVKFIRYNEPLLFGYIVGFSYLLSRYRKSISINILLFIAVLAQVIYGIMFGSIYFSSNTTLRAADWIVKNIPSNAPILEEYGNSLIRYGSDPLVKKRLSVDLFNFYTLPDKDKVQDMIAHIARNDYIILDSPKVRNTTTRLSDLYPYTTKFYQSLQSGSLGFTKIAEFTSYPHIGTMMINDENAEETWYVFDHPTVRIYKKVTILQETEIERLFSK